MDLFYKSRHCHQHRQQVFYTTICLLLCFQHTHSLRWLSLASLSSSVSRASDTESPKEVCSRISDLERRQREVCERYFNVMSSVSQGANMSIEECQHQFHDRRWNCSTLDQSSIFGNLVDKGTKEAAYIHAVAAAGVSYAVTKECSRGGITGCGCDRSKQGDEGSFAWSGCSDNVAFGNEFSRRFTNARERQKVNGKSLMNIHNNGVGRKIVEEQVRTECKCHGVSGSCEVKVCWRALSGFRAIGERLRVAYDEATEVKARKENDKQQLLPKIKDYKPFTETDLVYLKPSPTFCDRVPERGSLGTSGRQCDASDSAVGEARCDEMCCSRGYTTVTEIVPTRCNCKFHWCCEVYCDECMVKEERSFCLE